MSVFIEVEGEVLEVEVTSYSEGCDSNFFDPGQDSEVDGWRFVNPAAEAIHKAVGGIDSLSEKVQVAWDKQTEEHEAEAKLSRAGV